MGKAFYWIAAAALLTSLCAAVTDEDKAVAIATKELNKNAALLGRLFPMFSKFFLRDTSKSSFSFKEVFNAVMKCVDNREVAIFAAIGWGLMPLTQSIYEMYTYLTHPIVEAEESVEEGRFFKVKEKVHKVIDKEVGKTPEKVKKTVHKALLLDREVKPFKDTFAFQIADHISQASRIGILVMTVDVSILYETLVIFSNTNRGRCLSPPPTTIHICLSLSLTNNNKTFVTCSIMSRYLHS